MAKEPHGLYNVWSISHERKDTPMGKLFRNVYWWIAIVMILYAIGRGLLVLADKLPRDVSSTMITLTLLLLGALLAVLTYRQGR